MADKTREIIAAIATPLARGAIGCVRLSGKGSAALVARLTGVRFDAPDAAESRHARMTPCIFTGRVRDRIMAAVYYGDKSFTGEESAELYFHGGTYLMEQALCSVLDEGARMAEAGEFTRRAFLNGKIDLTQAEGIGDLIDGDSLVALEAAYEQSEGKTRTAIEELYDAAVTLAAKAEVSIDYPEEDIEEQTRPQLCDAIDTLTARIDTELRGYAGGRIRREGARVVLAGNVNAGKSTLFNTLLGADRAIVSDDAGTTRDTIEEKMRYGGIACVLIDTAGLRQTDNRVEQMGIERSRAAMQSAEIVVRVGKERGELADAQSGEIRVWNDTDASVAGETLADGTIRLNAKTGAGTEILLETIVQRVRSEARGGGHINNARQYEALKTAADSLRRARIATQEWTLDCVCADLRDAIEALGRITGRNASESIIAEIFDKFCVGK